MNKWTIKRLIWLLRLYGAHRLLWDFQNPDNRKRNLRKAALIDIAAALGEGIKCSQVVQKINVLRATYRYEKRRIQQRINKGLGAKTKLKWFALADEFLRNVPKKEKSLNNKVLYTHLKSENEIILSMDPETLVLLNEVEKDMGPKISNTLIPKVPTPISKTNTKKRFTTNAIMYYHPELKSSSTEQKEIKINPMLQCNDLSILPSCKVNAWTSKDSLRFVKLLHKYPILWYYNKQDIHIKKAEEDAILEIALGMQLPETRIRKRVNILRYICEKVTQNSQYKPKAAWWATAQTFLMSPENQTNHGPTAPKILQRTIEVDKNVDKCCSSKNVQKTSLAHGIPSKLICKGLEDDLLEGKWSLKHSVKFLRLYGTHRCLWDLKCFDFRSRELRNAAIQDIAAAMGYGLDKDYVIKKIKIFRITYMQHRKRMLTAVKQGKVPSEIQLRWFHLADSFLRPYIGLRCIKQHEKEIPQFDFQYVVTNLNLIDPALLADLSECEKNVQ